MKKACLVMLTVILSVMVVSAQENDGRSKKEIRKEAQKKANALLGEEALNAINERRFVLEIDKVTLRNGKSVFVTPRTNFIMLDGDEATVQLAGRPSSTGVTVEGTPINVEITTNKKGHLNLSMSVQGISISAQVSLNVPKNSNRGIATVTPNFHRYRMTMKGLIYPLDKATIFKGNTRY